MNCVVIFFGEETTQTQLRLTELIKDMKLETSHTLKATTEAQLSAQLKEGGNLAGLVIVIGGLDPLKNISAKNSLCATYGLPLHRSQKLYQQIEHICQESGEIGRAHV